MIRIQVDIDLRTPDSPEIVVRPVGHRTKGDVQPHVVLSLPDVAITLGMEDAERLQLDLASAIAVCRKRPVQEGSS
jgi:hypothetical protein